MELKNYLSILWRRVWMIIATTITTAAIVTVGTLIMTPVYQAVTTIRIATVSEGALSNLRYDITYADRLMNTYADIATSGPLLAELGQKLGTNRLPNIKTEIVTDSELMKIEVEDKDPVFAAKVANTLAQILITEMSYDVPARSGQLQRGEALSVIDPAQPPSEPSSPRTSLNIALGILLGLVGGCLLAFVLENLDTTLHSANDIEKAVQWPMLGQIPVGRRKRGTPILNESSPAGEAFRYVRTRLWRPNDGSLLRTLLVASAERGEGKSTIVTNLAFAVAQTGRRVLIIDCDLRQPSIHKNWKVKNDIGLSTILNAQSKVDQALQQSQEAGIWVLPSGPIPPNPTELLASTKMEQLLNEISHGVQFDCVLLDSPALLAAADGAVLARIVDGVVVVAARDRTHRESLREEHRLLDQAGAQVIGILVNRGEPRGGYRYHPQKQAPIENKKDSALKGESVRQQVKPSVERGYDAAKSAD